MILIFFHVISVLFFSVIESMTAGGYTWETKHKKFETKS